jgi:hypothetical protein
MSHQNNSLFKTEKINDLFILGIKKPEIFQIYTVREYFPKSYTNNFVSNHFDSTKFVVSNQDIINLDGIEENIKFLGKNGKSQSSKDLSYEKDSQNKKNENKKESKNLSKKSYKKELRKINKETINKKENKNTLIKPIIFEENSSLNKNIIQKPPTILNPIFPIPNYFNRFNFPFGGLINPDLSKNFNKFNQTINFKFPPMPINQNETNNTLFKSQNPTIIEKQKLFETKPINTFNICKFPKNTNIFNNEKINISPNFCTESVQLNNQNDLKPKNQTIKYINTRKGRKSKNSKTDQESKHTKFSEDNMMRKIKNKIIESSRLLVNKLFIDELKDVKDKVYFNCKEFRKIKGSFSQELNIKFNLYFYQMKIKEIFSLELSHKYTAIDNHSNKELINYIFSEPNKDLFPKTKKILDMPFHQYYHDIFLGEEKNWKQAYGIAEDDIKYQIEYLLESLKEEEGEDAINNEAYAHSINNLARDYEKFFLSKKTRNVDLGNKKEDCIKSFMENTTQGQYQSYMDQLKQFQNFYKARNGTLGHEEKRIKFPFILKNVYNKKDNLKINNKDNIFECTTAFNSNPNSDSTELKQSIDKENENKSNISQNNNEINFVVNNEKNDDEFLGKKRKLEKENIEKDEPMPMVEI